MSLDPRPAEVRMKPPASRAMDRRAIAILSFGHLADDMTVGALPAMLPYFIAAHDLTYTAAAGLMMAVTITSSFVQPLLGQLSDRRPSPWLMPVGMLAAGGGLALAALAPSYWLIWLALGLSGIGVAAFHPEAARYASRAAGPRRATGMSLFSVGGNAGGAVGPLLATPLLLAFGLPGGALVAVPAVATAFVMLRLTRRLAATPPHESARPGRAAQPLEKDAWGPFARLTAVLMCRSVIFNGLYTFVPLYWAVVLRQSPAAGGMALSLLVTCGAVGTVLGGWLADHYGRKIVLLGGLALVSPLLVLFLVLADPALAMAMLVPLGLVLYSSFSVSVVMGQEYLPNRIGTASGVTMGLAWSVGGLSAPLLGQVADQNGIPAALAVVAVLPLVATAIAATLPTRKHRP